MKIFWLSLVCSLFMTSVVKADDLAYNQEWLKLLHYQKDGDEYQGLVVNPEFYISPKGKNSPQEELSAEVKAFQTGEVKCEFPARFEWLKENGLVSGTLNNCDKYQQFMNDVRPNGITILFTNAYMSNPASLFGHTLIRIDTARKGTQMLAHGSNFGANSGTEYGFLFALKGLFGGYDGVYSISPYWEIINTYNNIENRDIWEYKLNLSNEEQIKFVNHLYEMQKAKITYYFLSKNCSYMILELLEAVRPDLELIAEYNRQVIPLDTLKTIRRVPNFVTEINYRPSRYSRIKAQIAAMNEEQYDIFIKGLKHGNFAMDNLSAEEQALVLETQYQYYQYKYTAGEMELAEYRKNSFAVLRKRSTLPAVSEIDLKGDDPSESHNSMQISVGSGVYERLSFEEFEWRPAYTALTDSTFGLVKGAETNVLSSKWRYYNQKHRLVLQNFSPLRIKSLVPADQVFAPISYSTDVEVKRVSDYATAKQGYVFHTTLGIGNTLALHDNLWLYGMFKVGVEYGGFITGNQWGGLLPEMGIYSDFGRFRLLAALEDVCATRKFGANLNYKVAASWGFTHNISFDVEYSAARYGGRRTIEEFAGKIKFSF